MSAAMFLKTACLGLSEVHTPNSCCNVMQWNAALTISKLFLYLATKIEAEIKYVNNRGGLGYVSETKENQGSDSISAVQ